MHRLPSLPKFVVVGDQSAGKSSVVEALCNITVPRDQGTCTRCPYQITTTASKAEEPWLCKVTLTLRYAYAPGKRTGNGGDYHGWAKLENPTVLQFATVSDRNALENILREAQLAILDPNCGRATPSRSTTQPGLEFSPNIISLDIQGPDLPELSFFDLPGAINQHKDDDEHLVGFIETLLKTYLHDDKALVLLACPVNRDLETSTAARFVGECKAKRRCMGVLTKPDLIERNYIPNICKVLEDVAFRLGNGWYVTKQLSQDDMQFSITHAEARAQEQAFFASNDWNSAFSAHHDRCGIPHLRDAISQKLAAHIKDDLPEIVKRVDKRLTDVCAELRNFPEETQSAMQTVLSEIDKLNNIVKAHIKGEELDNKFRSEWKVLLYEVRKQLATARPQVLLSTPGYVKPTFSIDSDDSDDKDDPTPGRHRTLTPTPMPIHSAKARKGNNGQRLGHTAQHQPATGRTPQHRATTGATPLTPQRQAPNRDSTEPLKFTLDAVKRALERGSSSGLPYQTNTKVVEHFALQSLNGWDDIGRLLMEKVSRLFARMLAQSVADIFASRRHTRFYLEIDAETKRFCARHLDQATEHVQHILYCEKHKAITYDHDRLRDLIEKIRTGLSNVRLKERVDEHYDTLESNGVKVPQGEERRKKHTNQELLSTLGADEYSREVREMATPLAYYDIAAARMLDTIANHLEVALMYGLQSGLCDALRTALRVHDETHCRTLLAEDPEREAKRVKLLAEKDKLLVAMEELRMLKGS